jgi:hypothetical protein
MAEMKTDNDDDDDDEDNPESYCGVTVKSIPGLSKVRHYDSQHRL